MFWCPFNFNVIIDKTFHSHFQKVYPEFILNDKAQITDYFTMKISRNLLPAYNKELKNIFVKPLKFGQLVCDLKEKHFNFFYETDLYMPMIFSSLLMQLIKLNGIEYQTFLIHAASVIKNQKCILIPGKQGRGKSTLAFNMKKEKILNDDLTLIVKNKKNGLFSAFKIPDPLSVSTSPFLWQGPFPLQKIVFIRHDSIPQIRCLHFKTAFSMLEEEGSPVIFPEYDSYTGKNSLQMYQTLIYEMFHEIPSVVISYHPDLSLKLTDDL